MTRRLHERILIGDGIVIEVVDVERNKVRIGITAPPDVVVRRPEWVPPPHENAKGGAT